jgi:hypothetical protein
MKSSLYSFLSPPLTFIKLAHMYKWLTFSEYWRCFFNRRSYIV